MNCEFGLTYTPGTRYIRDYASDVTIARCEDGVYGFGLEFDFAFLVSRTNRGALEWMGRIDSPPEGPTRPHGVSYDVLGDDVFGGPFAMESN